MDFYVQENNSHLFCLIRSWKGRSFVDSNTSIYYKHSKFHVEMAFPSNLTIPMSEHTVKSLHYMYIYLSIYLYNWSYCHMYIKLSNIKRFWKNDHKLSYFTFQIGKFCFQSGKASLGDTIYRYMYTADKFSPEHLLDCLNISSEHEALELADRVEASMYTWRRKACMSHSKSSWDMMKDFMSDIDRSDKNQVLAERAEVLLFCLKQRYPELSQTSLDTCKIQYNRVSFWFSCICVLLWWIKVHYVMAKYCLKSENQDEYLCLWDCDVRNWKW